MLTRQDTPLEAKYYTLKRYFRLAGQHLPLGRHHPQEEIQEASSALTLDLRMKLLFFGHRVEVLSPADFREELIAELRRTLSLYTPKSSKTGGSKVK